MIIRTSIIAFCLFVISLYSASGQAINFSYKVEKVWDDPNGGTSKWKVTFANTGKVPINITYAVQNQWDSIQKTVHSQNFSMKLKVGQTDTDGGAIFTQLKVAPIFSIPQATEWDDGSKPATASPASSPSQSSTKDQPPQSSYPNTSPDSATSDKVTANESVGGTWEGVLTDVSNDGDTTRDTFTLVIDESQQKVTLTVVNGPGDTSSYTRNGNTLTWTSGREGVSIETKVVINGEVMQYTDHWKLKDLHGSNTGKLFRRK
jgi:hypothetical protein